MPSFLERHSDNIAGVVSCFDRVIIQGTLPDICHPKAITDWFFAQKIRIFDFKAWAAPMRDQIKNNIETLAADNGLEIAFIRKQRDFRKEQRVKEIIAQRGDHPGLVHIFSAMESCTAFKPWHDKQTHATFFKYDSGRCLHYYVYFIDKEFGLCYLRIPTWAPFRLQFYFNGHNWLACQLKKQGIGYQQVENAFVQVDDFEKAQKLADRFPVKRLQRLLDRYAKKLCPPTANFGSGIHWSIMQAEYATDIIFADRETLTPIYEELVRTLSHAVKPDECVFDLLVADALLFELAGQPVVAVEVELQAEGGPSGDAKIAEAEFFVDEINVIVQAPPGVVLEKVGVRLLVVPRFEGRASLHGGEDVYNAGMVATLGEDLLDALLLAEIPLLANELDFQPVGGSQCFDSVLDLVTHRCCPSFEVENADVVGEKPVRDRPWMANVGQGSLDDNTVETRHDSGDVVGMTFEKAGHGEEPRCIGDVPQICPTYSINA